MQTHARNDMASPFYRVRGNAYIQFVEETCI